MFITTTHLTPFTRFTCSIRTGDSFTQGVYTVIKATGGKIQLRESVGGSTILVSLDRIDQRVNDPRTHVTGDDRKTLLALIVSNKVQSDATSAALRAEISALREQLLCSDQRLTSQVLCSFLLFLSNISNPAVHFYFAPIISGGRSGSSNQGAGSRTC